MMTEHREQLPDGRVRVTDRDVFSGKEFTWYEPEQTLTDTAVDAAYLLALRDEFKAILDDPTAEDRTERLLDLRERFLTWRELYYLAEASDFTDEGV